MGEAFEGWATYYYRRGYPPTEQTYRLVQDKIRRVRVVPPAATDPAFRAWLDELGVAHEGQITDVPESLVHAVVGIGGFMVANVLGHKVTSILAIVGMILVQWYGAEVNGSIDILGPSGEGVLNLALTALVAMGLVSRDPKDPKK